MVDTLVSGASASRHVGSSPISGTKVITSESKSELSEVIFFCQDPVI